PVAHEREGSAWMLRHPGLGCLAQPPQPVQLVDVVRVGEPTPAGHVGAPQSHVVDRDAEGAGLERLVGSLLALQEAGLDREGGLAIRHREAAREGDAVPLVEAVRDDLVTGLLEGGDGELLRLALDLLHAQHVDVFAHEPVDDSAVSGADGVDVPGGDTHATTLPAPSASPNQDQGFLNSGVSFPNSGPYAAPSTWS